jgi:cellobiose phosphorylase
MPEAPAVATAVRIANACGLSVEVNANGSLHRIDLGATSLSLFPGNELEGGPANLYLRCRGETIAYTPLLGPRSPTRFEASARGRTLSGCGTWRDLYYTIALQLAEHTPTWCWQVWLENRGDARSVDLIYVQDIALAPYGMVRTNEFYVSQYLDHTPLTHPTHGIAMASRQNLAAAGANPWCIIGSMRSACSFATDALQLYGLDERGGRELAALLAELPGKRLQHEHSLVALQDEAVAVPARARAEFGFVGRVLAHHPEATAAGDLRYLDEARAAVDSAPVLEVTPLAVEHANLFSRAPLLRALDLAEAEVTRLFGAQRRQAEIVNGELLAFFRDTHHHVVLRAKELRVLRPHGHLLHTGEHLVPDEAALTSTTWMAGVFHSMLTQGHVNINRCLATVRSYLSLFRSQGVRIFIEFESQWQLLDVPSAFEMAPRQCRWIYQHAGGLLEISSGCGAGHALTLGIQVRRGAPVRMLISQQLALDGDDSSARAGALQIHDPSHVSVAVDPSSQLGRRFPRGRFHVRGLQATRFERVGGDELLFLDGRTRGLPHLCVVVAGESISLELRAELLAPVSIETPARLPPIPFEMIPPQGSPLRAAVERLREIAPWFVHNALIHYLAPRGLEQYTGGGWGTRDVSQGPVELLLALGAAEPVRDLLLRVMQAQNPDGDWPQWFMFFERERSTRAADSHGDVVFWPVLALAQYLLASGDGGLLEESVAFFDARGADQGERGSVWEHVQRALRLIEQRRIAGTALAAYGHGDWNDSLQPADPAMREHMCSAWTVTLHHQMLTTLAQALRTLRRDDTAVQLEQQALRVRHDFQRLLLVDGVLAGYALFDAPAIRYLLHPRDSSSGAHYSSLAMIHAILEGMFTPQQARAHLQLIEQHLLGPDGIRLFDQPLPYHGGPQRFFQRAESATFFGREIGLMYMHAHLRYAQALAYLGEAERFFHALCQVNPIGIRELVPTATLRQSNCYYSSSDATFADRRQASAEYQRIKEGDIALEGGWRVYSSGPGIAVGLIIRHFLGVSQQATALRVDPVMPPALDGLRASIDIWGRPMELEYRVQQPGCGVTAVELNGRQLELDREHNPYRPGAALVSRSEFNREPGSSTPKLLISIGNTERESS